MYTLTGSHSFSPNFTGFGELVFTSLEKVTMAGKVMDVNPSKLSYFLQLPIVEGRDVYSSFFIQALIAQKAEKAPGPITCSKQE